jgi:GBP family porin
METTMRLKLLAALIGAGLAAPVLAQSNITIYGIADTGIQVSRFGNGTQYNMASGIADGSRLGFKGTEDIGGGYKAIFTLEARVELDTGSQSNTYLSSGLNQSITQGLPPAVAAAPALRDQIVLPTRFVNPNGALFDRQAFVGLITPGGAVLLGRQYTPGFEIHAISDPFETGTGASWGTITTGTGGGITPGIAIRANNAVQYRLQLPNGIGAAAMYGIEETGSLNFSKRFWGANIKYQANGIDAGIGYNKENDQNSNPSLTTLTAGGSYALGDAKLFAGFHHMKNDHSVLVPILAATPGVSPFAGIIGSNATINGNVFTLGAHYRIGAGRIMAGVSRVNDKKAANGDATLYGLGYDYNLSKQTDVYTVVSHVTNQNAAQYAIGGAGYSGGSTTQPGQDANALQIGIRHKF